MFIDKFVSRFDSENAFDTARPSTIVLESGKGGNMNSSNSILNEGDDIT